MERGVAKRGVAVTAGCLCQHIINGGASAATAVAARLFFFWFLFSFFGVASEQRAARN